MPSRPFYLCNYFPNFIVGTFHEAKILGGGGAYSHLPLLLDPTEYDTGIQREAEM
jgi:hypothetical protein